MIRYQKHYDQRNCLMSVSAAYWNNNSLLVLSTDSIDLMRNCKANDCYRLICNRIFCAWFSIRSLARVTGKMDSYLERN